MYICIVCCLVFFFSSSSETGKIRPASGNIVPADESTDKTRWPLFVPEQRKKSRRSDSELFAVSWNSLNSSCCPLWMTLAQYLANRLDYEHAVIMSHSHSISLSRELTVRSGNLSSLKNHWLQKITKKKKKIACLKK